MERKRMNTETYLRKKLTEKKKMGKITTGFSASIFFFCQQKSTERKNREEQKVKERRN